MVRDTDAEVVIEGKENSPSSSVSSPVEQNGKWFIIIINLGKSFRGISNAIIVPLKPVNLFEIKNVYNFETIQGCR